ncbi:MAG: sulfocyanin-like copper-binding protein [Devosia sp.]
MSVIRTATVFVFGGLLVGQALAAEIVTVTLTDKPGVDMANNDGIAMGGDHKTASMLVAAAPATLAAGSVTFKVHNTSQGLVHEMLVVKLTDTTTPLLYDQATAMLSEDGLGSLGEVPELEPGKSGSLTLDLTSGTYALLCNQPGHYAAGMWTLLTVN